MTWWAATGSTAALAFLVELQELFLKIVDTVLDVTVVKRKRNGDAVRPS